MTETVTFVSIYSTMSWDGRVHFKVLHPTSKKERKENSNKSSAYAIFLVASEATKLGNRDNIDYLCTRCPPPSALLHQLQGLEVKTYSILLNVISK